MSLDQPRSSGDLRFHALERAVDRVPKGQYRSRAPSRTPSPSEASRCISGGVAAINWAQHLDGRMKPNEPVIHSDPEIMGGTPVFVGTRVPLATLLDYLEAGQPLSEFLEDFPTVSREQAVAALEQAKEALLARARPA
jgi:uncharacterized protein (DUF433 family)